MILKLDYRRTVDIKMISRTRDMALVRKIEEPVNSESTWAYGGAEQRLDCIRRLRGWAMGDRLRGCVVAWLRGTLAWVGCAVEANLNEGKNH